MPIDAGEDERRSLDSGPQILLTLMLCALFAGLAAWLLWSARDKIDLTDSGWIAAIGQVAGAFATGITFSMMMTTYFQTQRSIRLQIEDLYQQRIAMQKTSEALAAQMFTVTVSQTETLLDRYIGLLRETLPAATAKGAPADADAIADLIDGEQGAAILRNRMSAAYCRSYLEVYDQLRHEAEGIVMGPRVLETRMRASPYERLYGAIKAHLGKAA